MRPESTTTSPDSCFTIVSEWTGLASGPAVSSAARWQAGSVAHAAKAAASTAMDLYRGRSILTCTESIRVVEPPPRRLQATGILHAGSRFRQPKVTGAALLPFARLRFVFE
jgi:hypothetical protein